MFFLLLSAGEFSENHKSYSEVPTLPLQELLDQIAKTEESNTNGTGEYYLQPSITDIPIEDIIETVQRKKEAYSQSVIRFSSTDSKLPEEGTIILDGEQAVLQTDIKEMLTPSSSPTSSVLLSPQSHPEFDIESIIDNLSTRRFVAPPHRQKSSNLADSWATLDDYTGMDEYYELMFGEIDVDQKKKWFFQWFKRGNQKRHSYPGENDAPHSTLQQRRVSAPAHLGFHAKKSLRRFSQNVKDAFNSSPKLTLRRQSIYVSALFNNAEESLEDWTPLIAKAYNKCTSQTCNLSHQASTVVLVSQEAPATSGSPTGESSSPGFLTIGYRFVFGAPTPPTEPTEVIDLTATSPTIAYPHLVREQQNNVVVENQPPQ